MQNCTATLNSCMGTRTSLLRFRAVKQSSLREYIRGEMVNTTASLTSYHQTRRVFILWPGGGVGVQEH